MLRRVENRSNRLRLKRFKSERIGVSFRVRCVFAAWPADGRRSTRMVEPQSLFAVGEYAENAEI